ncbi:MAG: ribbon-helix-helix domain-containing protein [archaeon]|nr:ribbon-helix-helix domain-containing protein [archaeon]
MDGKSLVELQIPVEEVENIDELVREGYYGCRSDAIRDIIRRGAARVRAKYPLHAGNENRRGAVEEKETAKNNLAPALTTRCKHIYENHPVIE